LPLLRHGADRRQTKVGADVGHRRRAGRGPSLVAGLWLCTGCTPESGAGGGGAAAGPAIVPVDSVLIEETGTFYIGNPISIVPDTTDGSILVSDFFENRILRFGRDGRLRQSYGRPGEGPGEFSSIGAAFTLQDTIVVGVGDRRKILQLFSATDGSYVGAYGYRGRTGFGGYAVVNRAVVFPSRELTGLTSVAIWRYPDDEIEYVVPLPDEYVRSAIHPRGAGYFAAFFSTGSAVAWPDTIMSAMSGVNEIFLSTWDGEVFDTLNPPAVRRWGVPGDIQEILDEHRYQGNSGHGVSSSQDGLHRLSGGATVVFHHDATLEGEQPHGTITTDVYVTVISPDRRTACVDGPVPHFKAMRPVHTVSRDTIFFLDRKLNEAEDGLETWVRMYRIDTSECDWLEVG